MNQHCGGATKFSESATEVPPAVPADLARSWLLLNPLRADIAGVMGSTSADRIILDLEDSVAVEAKELARDAVAALAHHSLKIWIRVNAVDTPWWRDDLIAIGRMGGVCGVMLAKTESSEQVDATREAVDGLPLIPLVESALGIERVAQIASSLAVIRLAFGIGDYCRDTRVSPTDSALSYPRSRLVVASRAAGLAAPIDGPARADNVHEAALRARAAIEFGMGGQLCLREEDVTPVNVEMAPSGEEVDAAQLMVRGSAAGGLEMRTGAYLPALALAHRTLDLAEVFGLLRRD